MKYDISDDSHEISSLNCYFWKKLKHLKLCSAANYRWRFTQTGKACANKIVPELLVSFLATHQ